MNKKNKKNKTIITIVFISVNDSVFFLILSRETLLWPQEKCDEDVDDYVEAWTPGAPWRCAVVSGTDVLAADPLSPVSCEWGLRGSDLFVQHIPQMLDWGKGI